MSAEPNLASAERVDSDESLYTSQLESGHQPDVVEDTKSEEPAIATEDATSSSEEAKPAVQAEEGAKVESSKPIEIAAPEAEPAAFVAPEGTTGVEAS